MLFHFCQVRLPWNYFLFLREGWRHLCLAPPQRRHRCTPGDTRSMHFFLRLLLARTSRPSDTWELKERRQTWRRGQRVATAKRARLRVLAKRGTLEAIFKDTNPFPLEDWGRIKVALWMPPPPPPPHITSGGSTQSSHVVVSLLLPQTARHPMQMTQGLHKRFSEFRKRFPIEKQFYSIAPRLDAWQLAIKSCGRIWVLHVLFPSFWRPVFCVLFLRGRTNLIFNVSISALMMQATDKQIRCG